MTEDRFEINKKGIDFYEKSILDLKKVNRRALFMCLFFLGICVMILQFTLWTFILYAPMFILIIFFRNIFVNNARKSIPHIVKSIGISDLNQIRLFTFSWLKMKSKYLNFNMNEVIEVQYFESYKIIDNCLLVKLKGNEQFIIPKLFFDEEVWFIFKSLQLKKNRCHLNQVLWLAELHLFVFCVPQITVSKS